MNANELYVGEFYAWFPKRPKGSIPIGAAKVEVTRIRKVKSLYDKNRKTEVQIKVIEPGKGYNLSYYKEGHETTVSSRELLDFWAFYKDEEAALLLEEERRTYDTRKRRARQKVLSDLLDARFTEKGLPSGTITVSYSSVSIPTEALASWLGISEDEVAAAVLEIVGPPIEASTGYTTD